MLVRILHGLCYIPTSLIPQITMDRWLLHVYGVQVAPQQLIHVADSLTIEDLRCVATGDILLGGSQPHVSTGCFTSRAEGNVMC